MVNEKRPLKSQSNGMKLKQFGEKWRRTKN